jgi:glycine dehydrogenase subunit 1
MFNGVHFNEFVIKYNGNSKILNKKLLEKNIQGGLEIKSQFPKLDNCMLFGTTEVHGDEDIERLVNLLKEISNV